MRQTPQAIPEWIRALKNIPCVYGAKLKGTNQWYIGSSMDFYNRYVKHKTRAFSTNETAYNANNKFYVAIREHGWDAFIWDARPQPAFMLKEIENDSIIAADSIANGFNSMDAYGKWPDYMKAKMSESQKGPRVAKAIKPKRVLAKDRICPRCNVNKCGETKAGTIAKKHCKDCNHNTGEKYITNDKGGANRLCPRCKVEKVGMTKNGKRRNYCNKCNRIIVKTAGENKSH